MLKKQIGSVEYKNEYNLPIDCVYIIKNCFQDYKFLDGYCIGMNSTYEFAAVFWIMMYHYSNRAELPFVYENVDVLRSVNMKDQPIVYRNLANEFKNAVNDSGNAPVYKNTAPVVFFTDNMKVKDEVPEDTVILVSLKDINKGYVLLKYNASIFCNDTIKRMEENYVYLWKQCISNPDRNINLLDPVCQAEKRLLNSFNNRTFDWDTDETFLEAYLRQYHRFKDNILHVEGKQVMTYRDMNHIANYYASELLAETSQYIGMYLKSDIPTTIAFLAIQKAGKTIVTINPIYPAQMIREIANQLDISVILTCPKTDRLVRDNHIVEKVILINTEDIKTYDTVPEINRIQKPDDICYITFTSGTTGIPKGVMITHRNIMIETRFAKHFFNYSEHTRFLHILNYSFDFGLFDFFISIYCGSSLYSIDKTKMTNFSQYISFINENEIDNINTTPTFFSIISSFNKKLPSLRVVHLGGEKVTYQMANKYYEVVDRQHCIVFNGYGPCEVTIGSAIHPINKAEQLEENQVLASVPIGPVTDDSYMYVLNDDGKMVPINVHGELYIGGKGVGKGYTDSSENEGKFVLIPELNPNLLYKTGDIVRWHINGQVEYVGRKDTQVKINGFRIELSEIDSKLMRNSFINQAKTIYAEKGSRKHLFSFITCNGIIEESELKSYLSERLPLYMIPIKIFVLEKFPLQTSGKIDEDALKQMV